MLRPDAAGRRSVLVGQPPVVARLWMPGVGLLQVEGCLGAKAVVTEIVQNASAATLCANAMRQRSAWPLHHLCGKSRGPGARWGSHHECLFAENVPLHLPALRMPTRKPRVWFERLQ